MSTESLKPKTPTTESPTSSGWDPFTVWRERVHKPRSKAPAGGTVVSSERPLALLNPLKQGS